LNARDAMNGIIDWFRGKARSGQAAEIRESAPLVIMVGNAAPSTASSGI